ncbi:hypothetical protein ACS5PN_01595 [Roseateles sp. NT4]|uniref:hypothetical protein n=1 Tax=Roseateles sp. NT4 TaxID=3453715 RepID=UPI003EEA3443
MKTTLISPLACAVLCLVGCGGGGGSGETAPASSPAPAPAPAAADLTARAYTVTSSADAVATIENGKGASIDYWLQTNTAGKRLPAQTLMKDGKGAAVRSFYDDKGELTRIVDDATGKSWTLAWTDSTLIATEVDAAGQVQSAYLVATAADGKLTLARIAGTATLAGQLTGQITGQQQAAFALTPKDVGTLPGMVLEAAQALPDNLQAVLPRKAALVDAGLELRQVLAGNDTGTGLDLVTEAWNNSLPSWTQHNRGRLLTGFVLGAACAGFVPGCQAVGIGVSASSLALLVGGWTAQQGGQRLINEVRQDAGQSLLDDAAPSAMDNLRARVASAWQRGTDFVQELRDSTSTLASGATLAPPADLRTERRDAGTRATVGFTSASTLPTVGRMPAADTQVSGMVATNAGETFGMSGTLGKDGRLNVSGTQDGGTATAQLQGNLSGGSLNGSYSDSRGRTGQLSGADVPLGQCQTQQQSGGQGSFSYAFSMGAKAGSVNIQYEMYTIPDRMDVYALDASGRRAVFSTGGLVSGSGGKAVSITAQTTLFVAMTAPNSGTAWDFLLSCPN